MPRVPEAASAPVANRRSYPKRFISGMTIAPMVATVAMLEPVTAPKCAAGEYRGDGHPSGDPPDPGSETVVELGGQPRVINQLAHEHEQGDGDENKASSFGPGDEGGMRHGRTGSLQDQDPQESDGPHCECDRHAQQEEKKQEDYSGDADDGEPSLR